MPRFDGTGPRGLGSFSGRGMGYCVAFIDEAGGKSGLKDFREVSEMPGGDGTGPVGMGPMTGRSTGFCAGYSTPGYANPVFGRGCGRGLGLGSGRGRGAGVFAPGYFRYGLPRSPLAGGEEQEADMLRQHAARLKSEIHAVNQRINELQAEGGEASE